MSERQTTDWRPIETAPKDGTALLLWCPDLRDWGRPPGAPKCVVGSWGRDPDGWSKDPEGWFSDVASSWFDHGNGDGACAGSDLDELEPTHWMPLPEPPHAE